MQISIFCLLVNFPLSCWLMLPLREGGPGIANTATSAINVLLLVLALRKKLGKLEMQELRLTLVPLVLTAVTAGLIAWFAWRGWEKYVGHATVPLRIGAVFVPAGIAGTFYILTALKLKIPAAHELLAFAGKRFKKT